LKLPPGYRRLEGPGVTRLSSKETLEPVAWQYSIGARVLVGWRYLIVQVEDNRCITITVSEGCRGRASLIFCHCGSLRPSIWTSSGMCCRPCIHLSITSGCDTISSAIDFAVYLNTSYDVFRGLPSVVTVYITSVNTLNTTRS